VLYKFICLLYLLNFHFLTGVIFPCGGVCVWRECVHQTWWTERPWWLTGCT